MRESDPDSPDQPSGPAAQVIAELVRRRRRTIRLPEDRDWLEQITPAPARLLSHMSGRRQIHSVVRGRYVWAPGARSIEQAVPPELIVDLALGGDYYVGLLSSLIAHRLTDLHSSTIYVAVPYGRRVRKDIPLAIKVVRLSGSTWPTDAGEVERFRAMEGTKEFAYRSAIERALVDGLVRPDLCAGLETVVTSWGRALRHSIDWNRVAEIGRRVGPATARRTAYLLNQFGLEAQAEIALEGIAVRGASTPLDRSDGFEMPEKDLERDQATGVVLNVPRDYVRGWVGAES